jgi:arsenite oxidase small subunit
MRDASDAPEEKPIAIEREQKVSRRGFNKLLTLSGLAVISGAVWIFLRGRSKAFPVRVVAHADEIPVGGSKIFTYPTDIAPCILARPAENTYVAYSRLCTHNSCPVFYQPEENQLECPCHGGVYSVADGSVIEGPPPRPLPRITLERCGNDLVATGVVISGPA